MKRRIEKAEKEKESAVNTENTEQLIKMAEKEKNAVLKNLEEQVICPVCLLVPKTGRMPMCRNGHTTCETCKRFVNLHVTYVI